MTTEAVDRRTILRYRGEPVAHEVRFFGSELGFNIVADCEPCGWRVVIDGGHSTADLVRLERQHAGLEDPPEGNTP